MQKKRGRKIGLVVFGIFILFFIFQIQMISSEEAKIIDQGIIKELNNSNWVAVLIDLKDISEMDNVFSNFSVNEIRDLYKSPYSSRIDAEITEEGFEKLINDSRVTEIYFNAPVEGALSQSVPFIGVDPYVWNLGYNGTGVKICVIDSGVNKTHADLQGKIIEEACFCSASEGGSSNCCYNGNSEEYGNNSALDNCGHGTHVTGIIASQDSVYKGVAYGADVYAVKSLNSDNEGTLGDIGKAIEWCISVGSNVISISIYDHGEYGPFGKDGICPTLIDEDINNATFYNVSIISISGNDYYVNGTSYPGCSANVTSVGASFKDYDILASLTNRGTNLDLLAPGMNIWSLRWNPNSCFGTCTCSGDYMRCSGTSMAAPHASGVAALLLDRDPTLTPKEIREILQDTGKLIGDPYDPSSGLSFPRINASAAIDTVCTCTSWSSGSCGGGNCSSIQRQYTRSCTPSGCDSETKCEYDETCVGGDEITVCSSGCDYTTIQDAIDNALTEDIIKITDEGTYDERVNMNNTPDKVFLNCQGATITSDYEAIHIHNTEYNVILNCIFNSTKGIYITGDSDRNEFLNNVFDVEEKGLESYGSASGDGGSLYVKDSIFLNAEEEGSYFHSTEEYSPNNNVFDNDSFFNNEYALRFTRSSINEISDSLFEDNTYGIYLKGSNYDLEETISWNNFSGNNYGIYIDDQDGIQLYDNNFCPSNTNYDIYMSATTDEHGSGNVCEKPDGWDDLYVTGCTYYCDTPPEVTLLYPPDNSTYTTQGDVDLVCQSDDNYELVNVSLYHNIAGSWQLNQTKSISGTSNITIFTLSNIPNGTVFDWNCFAYDNKSRGSFADENWSLKVIVDNIAPNVNIISPLNQTYNVSSIDFNITLNEYGICEYSLDGGVTNNTMGTTDSKNFNATNSSMSNGDYFVNYYCEDSIGNKNYSEVVSFNINITVPPNDTYKFYHKSSSGDVVAWLGNEGNIVLKGSCFSGGSCDAPGSNSFIVKNSTGDNVAFINSSGDMCVETGDCSDYSATCNTNPEDAFIYRNSSNDNVICIDKYGDLCLVGGLFENSNP